MSAAVNLTPNLWAFEKIPSDLQVLMQWVCWRYEIDDKGKIKKVPKNAVSGNNASVTNPADWHSFNTAVAAYHNGRASGLLDGIGMVFCNAISNYCGIDIDDAKGDAKLLLAHSRVVAAFKSYGYCERSPSGQGIHIIVKGKIEGTRDSVEAYSTGRYFTFTGHVLESNPIRDCQPLLDELQAEFRPNRTAQTLLSSEPQTADDDTVIRRMFSAKNGAKAQRLFNGISDDLDTSRVDLGFCNIIVWHSKNYAQVERIWLRSKLGQRDKVQRRTDYRLRTIRRAFDRHAAELAALKSVDIGAVIARAKAAAELARQAGGGRHV